MSKASDPEPLHYTVWATAWGPMGAVGGSTGLRKIVLPHYQPDQLTDLLTWEHPEAQRKEQPFQQVIQLTRDYFNGKEVDFSGVLCELPAPSTFSTRVLRAARTIAYGQTRSYIALADQIDRPTAARAVARVMAKNPIPLVIPCHRVVYADGTPGGFSAPGGVALKKRMLDMERRART